MLPPGIPFSGSLRWGISLGMLTQIQFGVQEFQDGIVVFGEPFEAYPGILGIPQPVHGGVLKLPVPEEPKRIRAELFLIVIL